LFDAHYKRTVRIRTKLTLRTANTKEKQETQQISVNAGLRGYPEMLFGNNNFSWVEKQ